MADFASGTEGEGTFTVIYDDTRADPAVIEAAVEANGFEAQIAAGGS